VVACALKKLRYGSDAAVNEKGDPAAAPGPRRVAVAPRSIKLHVVVFICRRSLAL
jgi:hypothetical protein